MNKPFFVIGLTVYLITTLLSFNPLLFEGGDNVKYILLGRSLADRTEYKEIWRPNEPEHAQYPPLFPLILAVVISLFGEHLIILKLTIVLFGIAGYIYFAKLVDLLCEEKIFSACLLVYATLPILIGYNHCVLTEIPFLFFLMAGVYYYYKGHDALAIIFCILMTLTRTIGIVWLFAVVIDCIWKWKIKYPTTIHVKNYLTRALRFTLFFIGGTSIYWFWTIKHSTGQGYLMQLIWKNPYDHTAGLIGFMDVGIRVCLNFVMYVIEYIPQVFVPVTQATTGAGVTFNVLMGIVVLALIIRYFGLTPHALKFFVIIYSGVILMWAECWADTRLLIPIIPILIMILMNAMMYQKKIAQIIVAIIVILNFCFIMISRKEMRHTPNFINMVNQYKNQAQKEVCPSVEKPQFYFWITGKQAEQK